MKQNRHRQQTTNVRHDRETRAQLGYRLRVARSRLGWSPLDAAQYFQVSLRTWHNWEAGQTRIPFAVYKLARVLARFELPGKGWADYRIEGDDLITPEGRIVNASEGRWWSLLCTRARLFSVLYKKTAIQNRLLSDLANDRAAQLGAGDGPAVPAQDRACPQNQQSENEGAISTPPSRRFELPRYSFHSSIPVLNGIDLMPNTFVQSPRTVAIEHKGKPA